MLSTCRNDNNSTKESNLCVTQAEPVNPLGQLKHVVHQELGIPSGHRRYRLPPYHIAVHTHQALKKDSILDICG